MANTDVIMKYLGNTKPVLDDFEQAVIRAFGPIPKNEGSLEASIIGAAGDVEEETPDPNA
jgi:hypothetical protein